MSEIQQVLGEITNLSLHIRYTYSSAKYTAWSRLTRKVKRYWIFKTNKKRSTACNFSLVRNVHEKRISICTTCKLQHIPQTTRMVFVLMIARWTRMVAYFVDAVCNVKLRCFLQVSTSKCRKSSVVQCLGWNVLLAGVFRQ